jgi:hypothetical protein
MGRAVMEKQVDRGSLGKSKNGVEQSSKNRHSSSYGNRPSWTEQAARTLAFRHYVVSLLGANLFIDGCPDDLTSDDTLKKLSDATKQGIAVILCRK